jgi:5-methylthioribose kinase
VAIADVADFVTYFMTLVLDNKNVFEYLANLQYCQLTDRNSAKIELIPAKNFNLLIILEDGKHILVKQESPDFQGNVSGEFWAEWQMQRFAHQFPDWSELMGEFLPEVWHFDPDNSILIIRFLADYRDLFRHYLWERQFDPNIAIAVGKLLGILHSSTFQQQAYHQFLIDRPNYEPPSSALDIIHRLDRISPAVFGMMPRECLHFFSLYQKFPSLAAAIADLGDSVTACCLIHNDLKLNNLLVPIDGVAAPNLPIKLIDWERVHWGDPAFDVGCLMGSYLELWLEGLEISNDLSLNESLQLAITPLELLQPSLFALIQAYMEQFAEIITRRSDFLDRAIQFAGLSLIRRIEITIREDRIFGNRGIMMLQVAKQLLCSPRAAIPTMFGQKGNHLVNFSQ